MRRATRAVLDKVGALSISIHALHEESDVAQARENAIVSYISIHALHEESDVAQARENAIVSYISIHALHEESDFYIIVDSDYSTVFQSTLSMRRATSARKGVTLGNV